VATVLLKDGRAVTTNANTYASNAFTPAANDLLIVGVVSSGSVAGLTMTDSQSLGWTFIVSQTYNTAGQIVSLWVANKLAANSSMTVTYGATGSPTGAIVFVWAVTGMTRTGWSAVRQKTSGALTFAAAGTPAPTFSFAPLTGNALVGCLGNVNTSASMTPPASWTETASTGDIGYSTPSTWGEAVQRDSGFTATTVTWGGTSTTAGAVLVLELDTSAQILRQSNSNTGTASSTTVTCVYKKPLSAGNALGCFVYWNSATDTCTVGDSVNGAGSWTAMAARLAGTGGESLAAYSTQGFYFNATAAGTPTVTATFQNARTDYGIAIFEIPLARFDQASSQNVNNSTTPTTPALTPGNVISYLAAMGFFAGSNPRQIGGGFTIEEYAGWQNNTVAGESITGGGSQQCTFGTVTSQDFMGWIASFVSAAPPPVRNDRSLGMRDFDPWSNVTGWQE
jgi:hypothetical protein